MTEATSGYLNQPLKSEAEAKSGRMVTLQLSVGELRDIQWALSFGMPHSLPDLEKVDRIDAIHDRLTVAIQEALNDD